MAGCLRVVRGTAFSMPIPRAVSGTGRTVHPGHVHLPGAPGGGAPRVRGVTAGPPGRRSCYGILHEWLDAVRGEIHRDVYSFEAPQSRTIFVSSWSVGSLVT